MVSGRAVGELLGNGALWAGLGASVAAGGLATALPRRTRWADTGVVLGAVLGAVLAALGHLDAGAGMAIVVGVLLSRPARAPLPAGWSAVSIGAAIGLYGCVPDTERAVPLLGIAAGLAVVAEARRRPWAPAAAFITVALAWLAVADGRPRASAVVGGVAVAMLHGAGTLVAPRLRSPAAVITGIVASVVAAAWCGRVVGLADTGADAVALLVPVVVALAGLVVVAAAARSLRQDR